MIAKSALLLLALFAFVPVFLAMNRGITALTLGLAGLVFCCFAAVLWALIDRDISRAETRSQHRSE